ncbi:MurR/RpiR family transcriptional regulator [Fulvimarina sp. MAC3]|uniref:MurR/RpiR family transcriptional regulator n=1 Tax=Fulvimarina sp. MAC3 TaxID=3148887 RepID=UPI0031FC9D09
MTSITEGERTAPASIAELLERLDRMEDSLPKRLKQCSVQLRNNMHLIAVSTVADMAAGADVPASAFMRFCQALGFSGYSPMQALFRAEYTQSRPDYAERLSRISEASAQNVGALTADFADAGRQSLETLSSGLDHAALQGAAVILANAETIHLVGLRRAFPIVSTMAYLLEKMEVPTLLHHAAGHLASDHAIRPGDAVFAVTFSPYSPETIEVATRAARRGISLVALSDTAECPLGETARHLLVAREMEVGAFRVPTAALTLATALSVAIGTMRKKAR